MDVSEGEFSVIEFYDNGTHAYVARELDAKSAVELAKACIDTALVIGGVVNQIVITDGGGFTAVQWERGKGIVFTERS
ncbi:hypothetical protein ABIB94_009428 [Bradyrhizobium sp. JR7.2]